MIPEVGGPTHLCDNNPSTGGNPANQLTRQPAPWDKEEEEEEEYMSFTCPFAQQQGSCGCMVPMPVILKVIFTLLQKLGYRSRGWHRTKVQVELAMSLIHADYRVNHCTSRSPHFEPLPHLWSCACSLCFISKTDVGFSVLLNYSVLQTDSATTDKFHYLLICQLFCWLTNLWNNI